MRFIFVRHGHYDGNAANKKVEPLSERGREAAKAAGEFLRRGEIFPEVVFTTLTKRTQQTAQLVLEELSSSVQFERKGGGFSKGKASLDDKLTEWLGERTAAVAMFVGHHPSQQYCLTELAGTPHVPRECRACVLVYERKGDGWQLVAHHLGLA